MHDDHNYVTDRQEVIFNSCSSGVLINFRLSQVELEDLVDQFELF